MSAGHPRRFETVLLLLAALLLALVSPWAAPATQAFEKPQDEKAQKGEADETQFLRLTRDKQGDPLSMDTAIIRYVPADGEANGPAVDLVSVVHVGERDYYKQLNKEFKNYDAVLYELVAPEGTKIPKGGRRGGGGHPVSALQSGMKDLLGLEFQLEQVDYSPENFIHADMSPKQMAKVMKNRGESFLTMFFRAMGHGMRQQADGKGVSNFELLLALLDENRALSMKRLMAKQFEDLDGAIGAFNGPDGSTLITERNKVALGVLRKQLDAGKKRVAIFYGAGHMPDMEERLLKSFGLKRDKVRWVEAWDLTRSHRKAGR